MSSVINFLYETVTMTKPEPNVLYEIVTMTSAPPPPPSPPSLDVPIEYDEQDMSIETSSTIISKKWERINNKRLISKN